MTATFSRDYYSSVISSALVFFSAPTPSSHTNLARTPRVHPSGQGPLIRNASLVLYVLALVFVALRLYTRCRIARTHGLDDALIMAAMIFSTIGTATIIMQVEYGWGMHASDLTIDQMNKSQFWRWVFVMVYYCTIVCAYQSICWLYLRMARGATTFGNHYRLMVNTVMVLTWLRLIISILIQIFQCVPPARYWDIRLRLRGCINIGLWASISSGLNMLTDFILFVLPVPLLYQMHVCIRQKFQIFIMFLAGLIPIIASTIRTAHLVQSYKDHRGFVEGDTSWRWALVPLFAQIETTLGIIAACLPTFNPLLQAVAKGLGLRGTVGTIRTSSRVTSANPPSRTSQAGEARSPAATLTDIASTAARKCCCYHHSCCHAAASRLSRPSQSSSPPPPHATSAAARRANRPRSSSPPLRSTDSFLTGSTCRESSIRAGTRSHDDDDADGASRRSQPRTHRRDGLELDDLAHSQWRGNDALSKTRSATVAATATGPLTPHRGSLAGGEQQQAIEAGGHDGSPVEEPRRPRPGRLLDGGGGGVGGRGSPGILRTVEVEVREEVVKGGGGCSGGEGGAGSRGGGGGALADAAAAVGPCCPWAEPKSGYAAVVP